MSEYSGEERRQSHEGIDLVQYGRLLEAVKNLTTEIALLRTDMEGMKRGKYILYGAMLTAGALGAGVMKAIEAIFKG